MTNQLGTNEHSSSVNKQSFSANRAFYLLLGVSFLLIFLLFSLLTKIAPLTISHVLYKCSEVMTGISVSLPHFFPTIFVLISSIVILVSSLMLFIQIYKTKVFVNRILKTKLATPEKIKNIAEDLGLVNRIDVVGDDSLSSFCYGILYPRICLSLKLVETFTKGELKAVLLHESYHLDNRDPLKILLSKSAISMFFFVPVLKDFHKYYSLSKELSADQLALKRESLENLKSALTKTINNLNPSLNGITAFAGENDLEQRVYVLTYPHFKIRTKISKLKLLVSSLIVIIAYALLQLPVHAMENGDGGHSYYLLASGHEHLGSCKLEGNSTEAPFSSQLRYTPFNYSPIIHK